MGFACEGIGDNLHQSGQENNRDAIVSKNTVQTFEYPEHSPCEEPEESEVNNFRETHWIFGSIRSLYTF